MMTTGRKPKEIDIEDLLAMKSGGATLRDIAAKHGCAVQTVVNHLAKAGVMPRPRPQNPVDAWSDEKKANVRARYSEGWTISALAKKMSVQEWHIWTLVSATPSTMTRSEKAAIGAKKHFSGIRTRDVAACRFATKAHEIEE